MRRSVGAGRVENMIRIDQGSPAHRGLNPAVTLERSLMFRVPIAAAAAALALTALPA
jgi:hypothetical protein